MPFFLEILKMNGKKGIGVYNVIVIFKMTFYPCYEDGVEEIEDEIIENIFLYFQLAEKKIKMEELSPKRLYSGLPMVGVFPTDVTDRK